MTLDGGERDLHDGRRLGHRQAGEEPQLDELGLGRLLGVEPERDQDNRCVIGGF